MIHADAILAALGTAPPVELVQRARRHGVLALVEGRLRESHPELSPTLERLHFERLAIAALQERETLRLVTQLEDDRVDVLTYKGQILSSDAYGAIGRRESGDLDLLVHHHDAARAAEILRRDGYEPLMELTLAEWNHVLRSESGWGFRKGEMIVDLHWSIASKSAIFDLPTPEIFADARTIELSGGTVRTLSLDHLALFLAVHGSKHRWERLEWVASFAAIAERDTIDWRRVGDLAIRLHARRRLDEAQTLARRLQSGESPAGVSRPVYDRRRDRARALAIALFQPKLPDWRWVTLPRPLDFLYPLVRVLRLLARSL